MEICRLALSWGFSNLSVTGKLVAVLEGREDPIIFIPFFDC